MKIKNISLVMTTLISALPLLVSATPLTIANATKKPFTVMINNYCAGAFGTIKNNHSRVATSKALNALCEEKAADCKAIIFKAAKSYDYSCTGKRIADFYFNVKTGLKKSFHSADGYAITASYATNTITLSEKF